MNTVSTIDQKLNGIYRELKSLEKIDRLSTESWQRAWNKHPDLHAQECELYRQRGPAQRERDVKEEKMILAVQQQQRRSVKKPKVCPTCGYYTLTT